MKFAAVMRLLNKRAPSIAERAAEACDKGDIPVLHDLLEVDLNPNARASIGDTLLMAGVWWNHVEVVESLLAVGADNLCRPRG
ncbi:MAG: hypothetical protein CVV05_00335 [Gammaproteobacteria bacterium HGW-Gammaproteobacteria-1]|jgi:ankyrin repeat protein|nr:MAG: hypothetical protein CVV05_00335 [Gammaproteobacteria bacterium HGW-Gammaproteobacteria-1]